MKTTDSTDHEIYAAIGMFAVRFEMVVFSLGYGILTPLKRGGLAQHILGQALIEGLTADPMLKKFSAVFIESLAEQEDPNGKAIVSNIVRRIRTLIEKRNDIIHRTWFTVGDPTNPNQIIRFDGEKIKARRTELS